MINADSFTSSTDNIPVQNDSNNSYTICGELGTQAKVNYAHFCLTQAHSYEVIYETTTHPYNMWDTLTLS